ncbi:MAG: endo alpha-1,4 polygalactosaminidase [Chloroflexia bacterium]|nr:endo alpha-1,4 polygalactosaminidase [Chloroflexia bacterium]
MRRLITLLGRASLAVFCTLLVALPVAAADWTLPPANGKFDYQIGGDYTVPSGVKVVSRDWFAGAAPAGVYGICYVNAFQTQPNEPDVDRPDEKDNWDPNLVLTDLGDDPNWDGEYLIDLSTAQKRTAAAAWVQQMTQECADKGFQAVEFDNLDSWTRFQDSPLAAQPPFGRTEAVAYATLLVADAHAAGLAAAQKNTAELSTTEARTQIGFDFAIAEECGRWKECGRYRANYGNLVYVIEYRKKDFKKDCQNKKLRKRLSIVLRDINVTQPGSGTYTYRAC